MWNGNGNHSWGKAVVACVGWSAATVSSFEALRSSSQRAVRLLCAEATRNTGMSYHVMCFHQASLGKTPKWLSLFSDMTTFWFFSLIQLFLPCSPYLNLTSPTWAVLSSCCRIFVYLHEYPLPHPPKSNKVLLGRKQGICYRGILAGRRSVLSETMVHRCKATSCAHSQHWLAADTGPAGAVAQILCVLQHVQW